ncbi:hypothetical protein GOV04_04285 [Candidatus Woesearchaeota archaeon]|nr:hypothetical protein [Candidatus Woesearchaeota archaeon]
MHYTSMMGYGMGWFFQPLILVLFFLIVWWLIKSSGQYGYRTSQSDSALDILKKRLASGEIDQKEFQRLKREIEK